MKKSATIVLAAVVLASATLAFSMAQDGGLSASLGRLRPFDAIQRILRGSEKPSTESANATKAVSAPVSGKDKGTVSKSVKESTITLYFPDSEALHLIPEVRSIGSGIPTAQGALDGLFAGPKDTQAYAPIVPAGTPVPEVTVNKGLATVDLALSVQEKGGGSTEESMLVYSIVQTLTGIEGIRDVLFTVGGKGIDTLYGHLDLSVPIEPDPGMVAKANG